ncbi:MAG: hypothetical protein NXI20_24375 [bacterium]|nr:hypothetical protein [bacterium]
MRIINIYVEGKGDILFIGQFLEKHFSLNFNYQLNTFEASSIENEPKINIRVLDSSDSNGGIDSKKLRNLLDEIKNVNIPLGIENIILLDADTEDHSNPPGGYSSRSEYLQLMQEEVEFEYFLMPNNQDDGNLENLLHHLISNGGKSFYECLDNYINCLRAIQNETSANGVLEISDFNKQKIEWYVYLMGGKAMRSSNRNYLDEEFWNLDSEALDPLKSFFLKVFT